MSIATSLSSAQLISALQWRYAVKKFDAARHLAPALWADLEKSLVLTPSSLGLQPWKFIVVTEPTVRSALVGASYGQKQPADCSHFVVFAVRRGLGDPEVDRFVRRTAEIRRVTEESLAKFRAMIAGFIGRAREQGRLDQWQEHQVYIALGQFMAAAALVGVDTCPMEGIDAAKYDSILGLEGSGYATVVACAAGYRSADDPYAAVPKVRFAAEDVIIRR
jgi:nitroreductase